MCLPPYFSSTQLLKNASTFSKISSTTLAHPPFLRGGLLLQTTKSREAYEAQQLAFLHRPFSSSAPRRSRPQSAGSAGWSGSRDRAGSSKSGAKENGFPNPPSCPPPVYHRSSSPSVSGGGGRTRGASLDTATAAAPALSATSTSASGGGVRLGKPRTRVRPSSANARVDGRPGAGQGVGGGGEGAPPAGSAAASVPRRVHVPRHTAGYGIGTPPGDDGKVKAGDSRGQVSVVECLWFALLEGVSGLSATGHKTAALATCSFGFWLHLQRLRPFKGEKNSAEWLLRVLLSRLHPPLRRLGFYAT